MATQATARAVSGLLHDLTNDEIMALTDSDNRSDLKKFLATRMRFPITYDRSLGIYALAVWAVGGHDFGNIDPSITPEHFPLTGTGIRKTRVRVEPHGTNETHEQGVLRLTQAGYELAAIGDLAGFTHGYPSEVAKWDEVVALAKDSRWYRQDEGVCMVARAMVQSADTSIRFFYLSAMNVHENPKSGILVLCE